MRSAVFHGKNHDKLLDAVSVFCRCMVQGFMIHSHQEHSDGLKVFAVGFKIIHDSIHCPIDHIIRR